MRTCPSCYAHINDITEVCPACNAEIPEGYTGNVAPPPVHLSAMEHSFGSDALATETSEEPRHTWIWLGNLISILAGIVLGVAGRHTQAIVYMSVIWIALAVLSLIISRFGARWNDLSFRSKALITPGALLGGLIFFLGALLYLLPTEWELEHPRRNRRFLRNYSFSQDATTRKQKERTQ
ncbi:MAG TPA: hypothetical protein VH540_15645 [Ktedonobacterales bacterium]